jgi:hypothetical protein
MVDELDRLEADLEAARRAVIEHLHSGVAVGYAGGARTGMADTPVDKAWNDRYNELRASADQALAAANQAWSTWLARPWRADRQ